MICSSPKPLRRRSPLAMAKRFATAKDIDCRSKEVRNNEATIYRNEEVRNGEGTVHRDEENSKEKTTLGFASANKPLPRRKTTGWNSNL